MATRRAPAKTKNDDGGKGFPQIKLITPPLQLSYPKIFDPEENDQGKDVWETDAIIHPDARYPKTHPKYPGELFYDVLLDSLEEVMGKHFGDEEDWPRGRNDYCPEHKIKELNPKKLPGPSVDPDGHIFRARSYQPVGIVDADKNDVLNKREAYGGRWAKLSLTITVYDQDRSKGCAIYLNNVQLLDNAESFGGRPTADQDFEVEDSDNGRDRGGRRDGGRSRERDADERDESRSRKDRSRDRGRGDDDDDSRDSRRGNSSSARGRDRDQDGERNSGRGGRDREDDRRSRGRDRDDEEEGRNSRDRSRGEDRGRRSSREEEEGESRSRGRDRDDERSSRSGRSRDDSDERDGVRAGRNREEGEGTRRGRGARDNDGEDEDRGRGRSRSRDDRGRDDEEEERPSSRRGSSRRSRDDDEDDDRWN